MCVCMCMWMHGMGEGGMPIDTHIIIFLPKLVQRRLSSVMPTYGVTQRCRACPIYPYQVKQDFK